MIRFIVAVFLINTGWASLHPPQTTSVPLVTVRNGTYSGVCCSQYDQDFFLGVPFAQVSLGFTVVATAG
jgi:triacylglycerol lipase